MKNEDTEYFKFVAKFSKSSDERADALKNINDQKFLENFIYQEMFWRVSLEALKNISNQEILKRIIQKSTEYYIQFEAAKKITQKEIIEELLILDNVNWKIKTYLLNNIKENKSLIIKLAFSHEHYQVRIKSLSLIEDKRIIAKIAMEDKNNYVRMYAEYILDHGKLK